MGDKASARLVTYRRRSVRAIPVYLGLTATAAAVVCLKPAWWSWTILGMTAFTLIGDILNVWSPRVSSGPESRIGIGCDGVVDQALIPAQTAVAVEAAWPAGDGQLQDGL